MNSLAYACAALVGTAVASAGSSERAIIAAMHLSEQPNYSWLSLVEEKSGSYEIEGKTTTAGITWVRIPMLTAIARKLGREADTQLEVYFDARRLGVVRIGEAWHLPSEIADQRENNERPRTMFRGSAAGRFGIPGGQSIGAAAPFLESKQASRPMTGQLFAVPHPHQELAILVSSHSHLTADGDVVTGALTEMGAALLLVREGQSDVEPLTTAGTFKLWLKNGVVTKYQLKLEGQLLVGHLKRVNVQLSSTTLLKDVGTTRLEVPAEAREKLALAR